MTWQGAPGPEKQLCAGAPVETRTLHSEHATPPKKTQADTKTARQWTNQNFYWNSRWIQTMHTNCKYCISLPSPVKNGLTVNIPKSSYLNIGSFTFVLVPISDIMKAPNMVFMQAILVFKQYSNISCPYDIDQPPPPQNSRLSEMLLNILPQVKFWQPWTQCNVVKWITLNQRAARSVKTEKTLMKKKWEKRILVSLQSSHQPVSMIVSGIFGRTFDRIFLVKKLNWDMDQPPAETSTSLCIW